MIYQGSRYEKAVVVTVRHNQGWSPTVFRAQPRAVSPTSKILMSDYDTLRSLAYRAYNDEELWWHIADANPDLLYPDQIPAGTLVRVPDVSTLR